MVQDGQVTYVIRPALLGHMVTIAHMYVYVKMEAAATGLTDAVSAKLVGWDRTVKWVSF